MASLDQRTDADVEIEVDIVEEYERPGSRLGFFGNPSDELLDFSPDADMRPASPPPSLMRTPDVRRGWTCSLFRKLSPLKISKPSAEPIIQEEEASEDVCFQDGLSLSDDEETDSDDEDFDFSFLPQHAEVHQPSPITHRYNCLPSPLNEDSSSRSFFFGNPPRHEYPHRGRSRNSLQTTKSFWLRREEVYLEAAYTGISPDAPSTSSYPANPPPPLSVHPRRGDLASLRDPFCVHMDRYFVGMPPWTISKALWMFDMHTAEEGQRKMKMSEPPSPTSPISEEGSESDSEDGDVSDETLVASDSDSESVSPVKRLTKTFMRPVVEPGPARLPWETNWYRRTELLLQLTRQ